MERYRLYARLVPLFFLAALLTQLRIHGKLQFALSDGWGYYVYLPSLVVDGDLNFRNQAAAQASSVPLDWTEEGKANPSPTGQSRITKKQVAQKRDPGSIPGATQKRPSPARRRWSARWTAWSRAA